MVLLGAAAIPVFCFTFFFISFFTSCSSTTPVDINFGSDAGKNFDAPVRETVPDTVGGVGGAGGNPGTGGSTDTGEGGAGGVGGSDDGGAGAGGDGGTALMINPQYQHPN